MGHRGFVGPHDVILVQAKGLAHSFVMKVGWRWGVVKIQVAAEKLVCTLARQHHFEAQLADSLGQQVGRYRSTNLLIAFQVAHHTRHCGQGFLAREGELVVLGPQEFGQLASGGQVRSIRKADRKGVKRARVIDFARPDESSGCGRDQSGVEAPRQQNAERHVGHEAFLDGVDQGRSDGRWARLSARDFFHPRTLVPAPGADGLAVEGQTVSGFDERDSLHDIDQRFHFGCEPDGAVGVMTDVQRADSRRVAGRKPDAGAIIEGDEGKLPIELFGQSVAVPTPRGADRVAIRGARIEVRVVINLAVDDPSEVLLHEGLVAARGVDDR